MSISLYEIIKRDVVEQHDYVTSQTLKLIMRKIGAKEYQRNVQRFLEPCVKPTFRMSINKNGYFLLNLKLCFIELINKRGILQSPVIHALSVQYDVAVKDILLLLNYRHDDIYASFVDSHARLAVNKVKSDVENLLKPLKSKIAYFVGRKLYFLTKTGDCDITDFYNDTISKAVQSYYNQFHIEEKTDLYWSNFIQRCCKNHINNIIKYNTSEQRGRIVNKDGHYQYLETNLTSLPPKFDDRTQEYHEVTYDDISTPHYKDYCDAIFIDQLLSRYESNNKKFIKILLGDYDPKFTHWLKCGHFRLAKKHDQYSLQDNLSPERFNQVLGYYLGMNNNQVLRLVGYIKQDLKT